MVVCTKCDKCRDNRYQWNRVRPKVFTSCRWIPGLIDYPRIGHCECSQSWCPTHCLGSRGSSDVERDSCLVKQEPHLSPSQIFLKFDLHIIVLYNCLHCYTTEPVPSTSSVGKRPTTPSTESSSKRVKQDSEELPLYWICGDRKVTCQAPYYGGLGLIRFRRKGLDYDGNAMDRTVFVTKDELTSLKTELPRAIEIMNNLSTQRNLPNKRHLMARLSPPDSSRMRYIEVSVFKKSMTSSVRVFYFKDGLLCPRIGPQRRVYFQIEGLDTSTMAFADVAAGCGWGGKSDATGQNEGEWNGLTHTGVGSEPGNCPCSHSMAQHCDDSGADSGVVRRPALRQSGDNHRFEWCSAHL